MWRRGGTYESERERERRHGTPESAGQVQGEPLAALGSTVAACTTSDDLTAAQFLHEITTPPRLELFRLLRRRAHYRSELAELAEVSEPSVSRHTNRLIELGLVRPRESKNAWTYLELTEPGHSLIEALDAL